MQLTYLLINFFTVIICLIFSYHPRIGFYKHFGAFIKSALLVGIFFILWDIWFTQKGVWWFNKQYILGINFFGLPLEEILFFICIPFSCVFTYFCLDQFFTLDWKANSEKIFVICSVMLYVIVGLCFYDKIYSFITFILLALSLAILKFILKTSWLGKASFIYVILSPGFVLVNGILTGTGLESPIVNYNPKDFLGIRVLTIPIEDFFYGYSLILWNIYFFQKLINHKKLM